MLESTTRLIDADVHPHALPRQLEPHLDERWRSHLERLGTRVAGALAIYPRVRNAGFRVDAWPEGGFPGSDLTLLQKQLLDEYGIDYAVLTPLQNQVYGGEAPEFGAALCRAVNGWIQADWLDPEPRLRGSISIAFEHADVSVPEIERLAGDERWAQVIIPGTAELPLGNRKYWPIYEAATAAGMAVAIHTGGIDMHRGPGWPSYYLEEHVWNGNAMAATVLSLICEGTFERFPDLQVVCVEAGISWAAALQWSLDSAWETLRDEAAPLERRPSETFREHFWFTTQPIEEPRDPADLARALRMVGMDDRIMFATDYPHWDFDSPGQALPRALGDELRSKILGANAARLYRLGVRVAA
jgi:predicted TIM-barrel fold metal-dependent hydrolase